MDLYNNILKIFTDQASSQPLAFLIALLLSFAITPLVRERAIKLGLTENKNASEQREPGRKKLHIEEVPRLGGIAILISIIITIVFYLAVFGRYTPAGFQHLELEGIATGALIIFFVGLLDDIKPLHPLVKLAGQSVASITVWLMGVRIEFLANPAYYINHIYKSTIRLDDISSLIVTVIFLVAITNAINLLDGVDGLAVGVCLIASIATWAITMSPLLNQPAGAVLAATMAGASFGFLRYNFNPAKIFLGDNGAYLLGFILACVSCIGLVKKITVVIISPILILIFAVPLFDTSYAVFRRALNKQPLMKPDLEHLHHKLLNMGLSQKQVNYLLYSVTFACGLLGTFILGKNIGIDFLLISASILGMWLFFSLVINTKHQKWFH